MLAWFCGSHWLVVFGCISLLCINYGPCSPHLASCASLGALSCPRFGCAVGLCRLQALIECTAAIMGRTHKQTKLSMLIWSVLASHFCAHVRRASHPPVPQLPPCSTRRAAKRALASLAALKQLMFTPSYRLRAWVVHVINPGYWRQAWLRECAHA